jgi:hypothetical protein
MLTPEERKPCANHQTRKKEQAEAETLTKWFGS